MNMKYAIRSEDTEQINVILWANHNIDRYPELRWLFHVPNGGSRNKAEAVKLKQMGVKEGVSDLCLPFPRGMYCGLFIEMKFRRNRQQDTQKEFLANMAEAGHFVATCYSAEEAIKVIKEYLKLPSRGKDESIYRDIAKFTADDKVKEEIEANLMPFKNNSVLQDGQIKENKQGNEMGVHRGNLESI